MNDSQPPSGPNGRPEGNGNGPRRSRKLGSILLAAGILLVAVAASVALIGSIGSLRGKAAPATPPADMVQPAARPSRPATPAVTATTTASATATATARTARQAPPPLVTLPIASPSPTATPRPEPTPAPRPATPTAPATPSATAPAQKARPPVTQITIPAVGIDTKVVQTGYQITQIDGKSVMQWQVADFAAGHAALSAEPGGGGNIVIAGHDDWKGQVFENLHEVKLGDQVNLTTPVKTYHYVITEIHYRKAIGATLADQLAAGQFLAPMPQERVTLVTCWPYGVDSYRLIVVAKPVAG